MSPAMILTQITYCWKSAICICDGKCNKAWGVSNRPRDENDDYLPDSELGEAPKDPGTYEGRDGKPDRPLEHNKWCVRECERSKIVRPGEGMKLREF